MGCRALAAFVVVDHAAVDLVSVVVGWVSEWGRAGADGADIASRDSPIRTLPEELPAVAVLAHDGRGGRGRRGTWVPQRVRSFPRPNCLVEGRTSGSPRGARTHAGSICISWPISRKTVREKV